MKYHIAFSGVFDIANYGDHLFPDIFEIWMRAKGIDCQLDLYSPIECQQAFNKERHVYATRTLAQRHEQAPYDAFVVSGGALIQFRSVLQRMNGTDASFRDYPIFESWVIPSLVAQEKGVPLLWNCPGVPYDFCEEETRMVRALTDGVDFLAVRNEASAKTLEPCVSAGKRIAVAPDPAFLLPRYYGEEGLRAARRALGLPEKYIVFHTHRLIPKTMLDQVIETLRRLSEAGENIVLLPLAYTHADEEIGKEIATLLEGQKVTLISEKLNLEQMIAVLSGCRIYIGVSFHGAITSFAYGKKVLAFDFFQYRKTKAVFETMGEEEYYLTDADLLCEKAFKLLREPSRPSDRLRSIQKKIDSMYEAMLACLQSPGKKEKTPMLYAYVSLLHDSYSKRKDAYCQQVQKTEQAAKMLKSYNESLGSYVNSLHKYQKSLTGFVEYLDHCN